MNVFPLVLAIVAGMRLAELAYARHNTRRLLARGALEAAPEQHRWFVVLHAAWLVVLAVFVRWNARPNWWLLALFAVLQAGRIWAIASLGPFWTTRVITLPDAPLVRRGPYRFMRHPNYAVVACEIAVLPLAFGAWQIAIVFSALNATLLAWRLYAEEHALAERRHR